MIIEIKFFDSKCVLFVLADFKKNSKWGQQITCAYVLFMKNGQCKSHVRAHTHTSLTDTFVDIMTALWNEKDAAIITYSFLLELNCKLNLLVQLKYIYMCLFIYVSIYLFR